MGQLGEDLAHRARFSVSDLSGLDADDAIWGPAWPIRVCAAKRSSFDWLGHHPGQPAVLWAIPFLAVDRLETLLLKPAERYVCEFGDRLLARGLEVIGVFSVERRVDLAAWLWASSCWDGHPL